MPWKLVPPREGKTLCWYIRGKYLGIRLDHSTGTGDEAAAKRILATWRKQAERGEFSQGRRTDEPAPTTFVSAATAYMQAGGSGQYLEPILKAWKERAAKDIDQIALDALAAELYPKGSPATRNRQVYTPVSAVLKHVGIQKEFKRPRGSQGNKSTSWLEPDQAFAALNAADEIDLEFGLLCETLLYTGMRLHEALSRHLRHLRIERAYLYLPDSKTGEPRGCHLPPELVRRFREQPPRKSSPVVRDEHGHFLTGKPLEDAGVPFLERHPDAKLFRFHDGGALRDMLKAALRAAGLSFPRRQGGFHLFCHTYGSWMHRYGGLDRHGLARTGRWADPDSADRYIHTQASEEARRADLLPMRRGQLVEIKKRTA
jgi:integrase